MNPQAYLQQQQQSAIQYFQKSLRKIRQEHGDIDSEVLIAEAPNSDDGPTSPMRIDAVSAAGQLCMIAGDEVEEGPLVGTFEVQGQPVRVYPFAWNNAIIWFRCKEFHRDALNPWFAEQLDLADARTPRDDGLRGVVHFMSDPRAEGGGWLLEIDFGTADVAALHQLLQRLIELGATALQVGYSTTAFVPDDLARRLQEKNLTPESFHDIMLAAVKSLEHVADAKITEPWEIQVTTAEGHENKLYLGNIWSRVQRAPAEGRVIDVGRTLRMLSETLLGHDDNSTPDLSQLRPVIRHHEYIISIVRQTEGKVEVPNKPYIADIYLACVWDEPNGMRLCQASELEAYGLSTEAAFERAIKNYLEHHGMPELHNDGPLTVIRTNDAYEASLLLDDEFWNELAKKTEGELIVTAPARDILLFTTSTRKNGISALQKATARIIASGDHVISDALLTRREGKWELLPPPPKKKPWYKFW